MLLQGNGTNGAQNNTFLDSSSNNFSITRNGNTTQGAFTPFQQSGYWSNYFDGTGDYLTLASGAAFAFGTGDFTVECFVYINSFPANPGSVYFVDARNSSQTGTWAFLTNNNGTDPTRLDWYTGSTAFTGAALTANTWSHIVYTRSSSTYAIFINGTRVATGTDSTNYNVSPTTSYIAARYSADNALNGYMSNLRVVKGSSVYSPSSSTLTIPTTPLTAITNTQLLTCQSNRFVDNSASPFTLTVYGTPSVQAFQPFPGPTTWSASVLGGSGYFDGTGDNLSIANNAAFQFGSGDFTVEAWVYAPSNPPGIGSIVSHSDGASASGTQFLVRTEGSNTSVVAAVYSGGTAYVATWSSALPIGQWNHVAFTRSGTSTYLWVNGVQRATASVGSVSLNTTSTALTIGSNASASADNWLGYISGTRITKGAALYTATFTPPTAPPTTTVSSGTVGVLLNFTNAGIFDAAVMNDLETVGNAQVSTSVVKYGTGSMAFDGSGDYLKYLGTNVAGLGSGNFTIEFWINAPLLNDKFILGLRGGMSGGPHVTTGGYGGTTVGALRWASSAGEILSGTTVITDNTWHHCAIVRNGSIITLYVDGISRGSGTDTTAFNGNGGQILIGENDLGTNTFTGYLDDLRITKGAARYISNFTPPPARMPQQ
jgi:hypothetical protein